MVGGKREGGRRQVRDPESSSNRPAVSFISRPDMSELVKHADARVTLHMAAAVDHPAKVRNVAGVLRGPDPALKGTHVMLTAHFDHLGLRATGEDRIYNGANDDGSGTGFVVRNSSAPAGGRPPPQPNVP